MIQCCYISKNTITRAVESYKGSYINGQPYSKLTSTCKQACSFVRFSNNLQGSHTTAPISISTDFSPSLEQITG